MFKRWTTVIALAFAFLIAPMFATSTHAADFGIAMEAGCEIPDSGPWPPCATGGGSHSGGDSGDCVIPDSGPWPPCATSGGSGSGSNTGGGAGAPCPTSGAWPAGCVPGGSSSGGSSGGAGEPCPTSGAWPAGCVPGGSGGGTADGGMNDGGSAGGGAGEPCPTTGAWPAGCVPGGSSDSGDGGTNNGGNTGGIDPDNFTIADFERRCGLLEYDLMVYTDEDVTSFAEFFEMTEEAARDLLELLELVETPGPQGPVKTWDGVCFAYSTFITRNAAEQMGGLLDRIYGGQGGSCFEWLALYQFIDLAPAYSDVPGEYAGLHNEYVRSRNIIEDKVRDISLSCIQGGSISEFNFNKARAGINEGLDILNRVTEDPALLILVLGG